MKSFSWRTGPNTFNVRNLVEEDNISEIKRLVFYPHGVQVRERRMLIFSIIC